MPIGSLDWPVQPQKILYLAYLNWSLLHFFLILFIQTSSPRHCIPSFSSSRFPGGSDRGRITASRGCNTSCTTAPEQTMALPELLALTKNMDVDMNTGLKWAEG